MNDRSFVVTTGDLKTEADPSTRFIFRVCSFSAIHLPWLK